MRIREIMTAWPWTVTPADTLRTAFSRMRDHGFRHLPVVKGDEVVGMITDRDIRMIIGPDARDLPVDDVPDELLERPVAWFMSSPVETVDADDDVAEACRRMAVLRIGALPVVDEDGTMVGICSVTDVLNVAAAALEGAWE